MDTRLLEKVKKTVKKASKLMFEDKINITEKGSVTNIVTSADINVQKFLQKELCNLLPQSDFLGEESDHTAGQSDYCWIVDPIDGTQNFARRMEQSAISVGLRYKEEMVLGVVFNPFLKEMFWAEKGKGAYLNKKRIHVSDKPFNDSLFCTAMCLYKKEYAEICNKIIMETYCKCNDIRRFGVCSLELCYLADGRLDLYYEYRLFPWDYAAASLILTEAGGVLEDSYGNPANLFSQGPLIAANNRKNLDELKAISSKYMPKEWKC